MSTAAATPAASDFTSARGMMDSLLDGPAAPESTEVIEQEAPPEDPDNPEGTAPESEVPEDEELGEDTPPADDDDEDESIDDIKDGKKYRVNPTKMRRLLEASKIVKAVQEHFEPTPDKLLDHYQRATAWNHMTTDFKTGDPANIRAFMEHWAGESPAGFAALAQNLPAFLAQTGHAASLKAIESQVQNAIVQRAYTEVAQIAATPEKDRSPAEKAKLYRAQTLDYSLNGSYKKDAEIQAMGQKRQTPNVDRRAQELDQREKNFADSRWTEFDSQHLTGARDAALSEVLDAAFKPVEGKYSDKVLKALKRDAREEIQTELNKKSEWMRNQDIEARDIQREFRQALKTNSKTNLMSRIEPWVSEYRQVVGRIVPNVVKGLTPGATKAALDASKAEHDRLARGARQTAPSGGGMPSPKVLKGGHKDVASALTALIG